MLSMLSLVAALVGVAALVFLVVRLVALPLVRWRGVRLVRCPATHEPASVELDEVRAALTGLVGAPDLRIKTCSRQTAGVKCGQSCLEQIAASPDDCLVRTVVSRWYENKDCVLCRKPIGEISWHQHQPALWSPEHTSLKWNEVPFGRLPQVLATHAPLCWDCHIAETFRRLYPELVIEAGGSTGRTTFRTGSRRGV